MVESSQADAMLIGNEPTETHRDFVFCALVPRPVPHTRTDIGKPKAHRKSGTGGKDRTHH